MKKSRILFLIYLLPLLSFAQDSLKIMTYNIWDGLEHKPDRRDRFVEFIRTQSPDIVMLDELVELYADSLAILAKDCGYPYSAILKEEWYPVGVMSKTPIDVKYRNWSSIEDIFVHKRGLWHGLLHARTAGIDLLVTHLSPFDWKYRLNEAKFICNYADSLGLKDYLVAGDLNSHSPYDAARLSGMKTWLKGAKKGDEKRPLWNNINEQGMFDITTQSYFITHGFIDPIPLFITDPDKRITHPTFYSRNVEPGDPKLMERQVRIDYILLSPALMERCVKAEVFYVEGISDHYPVMVTLLKKNHKNPHLSPDDRAEMLLEEMTVEEKLAQIRHLHSGDFLSGQDINRDNLRSQLGSVGRGFVEGFPLTGENCARNFAEVQKYLVDSTRLGIPAFIVGESLHGSVHEGSVIYPQNIALASTFNPALAYKRAVATSDDLRYQGINQVLSPCIDVVRDLRWGRVEETYGEDPVLNSIFARNEVKGYLDSGVRPMLKHFGPHGNPSGGLNLAGVNCSPMEFRDVYMYPFEQVIRNLPVDAVMSSYNTTNGIPNSGSRDLLTGFLRDTLGFKGYVYSDWGAIEMLNTFHRTAPTQAHAAVQAFNAGLDVEASSNCYPLIPELIKAGYIDSLALDRAVFRVLRAKFAAGLFENPYAQADSSRFRAPENVALSRRIADEAIVLLQNNAGLLPLDASRLSSVAVIGPNADQVQFGDYSWSRDNRDGVTPLSALRAMLEPQGVKVSYAPGASMMNLDESAIQAAVAEAAESDVAILFLGSASASLARDYSGSNCGEGFDLPDLDLPGAQQKLLEAVAATGKPVVLVLVSGKPFAIPWAKDNIPAIVAQFYSGEQEGAAIADMLFGVTNPSGHLTVSFPRSAGHLPAYYNHLPGDRGYYHAPGSYERPGRDYVFSSPAPLWAFGHGLSYTPFRLSSLDVTPTADSLHVSVTVTNLGERQGKAVPQLYLSYPYSRVPVPVKMLKNFAKVTLDSAATARVDLSVPLDMLLYTLPDGSRVMPEGEIKVMVGQSSDDPAMLNSSVTIQEVTPLLAAQEEIKIPKHAAKKMVVSGQVRDPQATVIPAAEVHSLLLNRKVAVTDSRGRYSATVPANDILLFTKKGYAPRKLPVDANKTLSVTLPLW